MPKKQRQYKLDDGQLITVKQLMERTGLTKTACYFRLARSSDPEEIFKPLGEMRNGMKVYRLDDGSDWTAPELAEYLDCKKATASTRLSMMNGEAERILAPVKSSKTDAEIFLNSKEVRERVAERMYEDSTGFWKTFYGAFKEADCVLR